MRDGLTMEYRDDLRALLLDGLSVPDRRRTLQTIDEATAKKLAHLRRASDDAVDGDGSTERRPETSSRNWRSRHRATRSDG